MARTTDQIYQVLTTRYVAEMNAIGVAVDPSTWSQVNLQRLLFFVVAFVFKTIEELFDQHKAEIDATIAAMKPHSLQWYAEKAKAFRYGQNLIADSDKYDDTGLTAIQIAAMKIIAYAAVVEQERGLRIKVAKLVNGELAALSAGELAAFVAYMQKIKDAGVKLNITSGNADALRLSLRIKYNALVLNGNGERIDGTSQKPVQDAIKNFLKNLPFNGVFSVAKLVDAIQAVDGVSDVKIDLVQTQYGALPFTSVDIDYTPDSGYLRILDADLTTQFLAA
jgi:hypothetical protein